MAKELGIQWLPAGGLRCFRTMKLTPPLNCSWNQGHYQLSLVKDFAVLFCSLHCSSLLLLIPQTLFLPLVYGLGVSVCVCVCMPCAHVCVYVCARVCHVHTLVCVWVCVRMVTFSVYVCAHACHGHMFVCVCVCVRVRMCACVPCAYPCVC